jgi:hypothetical protein
VEEGQRLIKSNKDEVSLIKVHYIHVCKYYNETTLYTWFMLIKYYKNMQNKIKK